MSEGKSRNYFVDALVIIVILGLVYLGYVFIPAYVDKYQLKNNVHQNIVALSRTTKGQTVKTDMLRIAKEFKCQAVDTADQQVKYRDLNYDDITVTFENNIISVHFECIRVVPIKFTNKEFTIKFVVDDQKDTSIW